MVAPYGHTDSAEVVASYLLTLLQTNAATLGIDPQRGVFYGDTELLPTTPYITIMPGPTDTQYNGLGGRPVMKTYTTYIMVYYGKIQDQQLNIHSGGALSTLVERVIHTDITLGGNVIDALCTAKDPGVARRGGTFLDAERITIRSRAKVLLNA